MPPDDGEWSFCPSWSGPPASPEVEVSCSIRMLTAENTKSTDNMNRIISSPTKKYSFITRSPRIWRSKSMTREYIYFPIISSDSDNLYTSWLRNVKSLSSLQGKDEKQMINEELKNREASQHLGKEGNRINTPHGERLSRQVSPNSCSFSPRFQCNDLTASGTHIDDKRGMKTKTQDGITFTLPNELNNEVSTDMETSAKSELSDNLPEGQNKPGKKIKRSPNLRAWNPSRNRKPVLSSFKPEYNVLQPNSVVALSHQFEKTPSPSKTLVPDKMKIELYSRSEVRKRRRTRTAPVHEKMDTNSSKIRANSLPDENSNTTNNTDLSPKSVKKIRLNWEPKTGTCSSSLSRHATQNRLPSYDENSQSARQILVRNEYKQRASITVSNLKSQFENFYSAPSPNSTANTEGSIKSHHWYQLEKFVVETPVARKMIPAIITSSIKSIRMQFEQQSLNKKGDSGKLKPLRHISPSKSPPILNLLAKFDPSISCSSMGRDSTASSGSYSDNEVFDCDENSQSNKELENSDIFVSRLKEKKKKVKPDDYLRQREKEKEAELNRLIEQRNRDAIMAEKKEVERLKKVEEEKEKEQREKEREQERRRIEAEKELQRKKLEEEKERETVQRAIDKEKQRIAIEEDIKRAKKLREDELRKEVEEREKMKLRRIEEEKELEVFEREKLVEARERMEAELQKEKEEKLKKYEEKIKQLQIERGLYLEKDMGDGVAAEADVDNLITKFEKSPKRNESDIETSPCSDRRPLSHGSSQSLSNCRPLNPDELQLFMGVTTTDTFMRTQSLRIKPNKKKSSSQSRMKRSNSMSEKSSPILVPNKPRISMGPQVAMKVPENCRHLRPEEWKFFLGDMTSSKDCKFNFSDSE